MSTLWNDRDLFIIAEIGGNHEGDFEYAKKLTHLACQSKANSIKYQVYTGNSLVSSIESPDRNSHFKKFELTKDQFLTLYKICSSYGKDFSASVWNSESLEWIDPFVTYYKIGSGDLTCYPIIKKFIRTKKPIILSTGLSTEEEVKDCVNFIQSQDSRYSLRENLAILQCNSMYPSPDEDVNLNIIGSYKKLFPNSTIGYSDHSIGSVATKAAIALGSKIIEVHFTDDRSNKVFRDHLISFTCEEIDEMYEYGVRVQKMLGSNKKMPTKSEIEAGHLISFRRAVYFNRNMNAGEIIEEQDLCFLRPCHGIEVRDWNSIISKKLRCNYKAFQRIERADLE